MAVLVSRIIPWIFVLSLVFGAYKLWMWGFSGGPTRIDRARVMFLVLLAIAIGIVIASKLF